MRARLGDDIDDFCVKCKRVMNHLVVSLLSDEPAKVRCRTCHGDHDFRHEQAPPPKIDARKAALIQQALEKAAAASATADGAATGDTPVEETEVTVLTATVVVEAPAPQPEAESAPVPARKRARAK